jgi:hypothetical protein
MRGLVKQTNGQTAQGKGPLAEPSQRAALIGWSIWRGRACSAALSDQLAQSSDRFFDRCQQLDRSRTGSIVRLNLKSAKLFKIGNEPLALPTSPRFCVHHQPSQ